jgi:site-specific DNA-methyltransferase (adenine-specific)
MLEINKIYNEDCLEGMKRIDDKSVDCIICDLPYQSTSMNWDVQLSVDKLWEQYERIIKPKGNIILFGSGLFAFKLALSNEKLFRYDMVWKKSKCGSPLTAKYMPMKRHEMVLVFGESAAYYEPQMSKGTPYKRKYTPNKVNNLGYGIKGVETDNKGTRHPITVLDFPQKWRRQDQIHPTQKPVELIEFLVKSYCPEGGLVLDNCMGSGTTAVACFNTNRKYIGFEIEEKYFKIANVRIIELLNNETLF